MMQAALSHTSSYTVVVVCTLLLFILSAEAFRLPHSRHVTFSKSSSRKHPEGARLTTVAPRAITCREDRAECDDTNDRGILYSRKDLLRSVRNSRWDHIQLFCTYLFDLLRSNASFVWRCYPRHYVICSCCGTWCDTDQLFTHTCIQF